MTIKKQFGTFFTGSLLDKTELGVRLLAAGAIELLAALLCSQAHVADLVCINVRWWYACFASAIHSCNTIVT